jgi:small-conductance mechanosensitive channel
MTQIQIIETVITLVIYVSLKILIHLYIDRIVSTNATTKKRSKVVKKAINLIVLSIFLIIIFSIFGVDQSELMVFIGSVLTVMGIALFAQWSILSNITSGVIIFFSHSAKLNDVITIMDKDYEIQGRISDIGLFFVILKTTENEQIDIPNSVFLNKMIKKKINT